MAESPHRKRGKVEPISAQTSPLVSLPQIIIDLMAKHLDLKSLIRLQLTCRDLFAKCLDAQRLKTVDLRSTCVLYDRNMGRHVLTAWARVGQPNGPLNISITEHLLRATRFRIVAGNLRFVEFDNVSINFVRGLLSGRSSVERLAFSVDVGEGTDPVLFERLIRELKIFHVSVRTLPIEFWQLPSVKQLTILRCLATFPLPVDYLAETAVEDCWFHRVVGENLFSGLNTSLQKWAKGKKEIKKWTIVDTGIVFNEEEFFEGFYVVPESEKDSRRRPLAVRTLGHPVAEKTYTVERADGEKLYVECFNFGLEMKNTPSDRQ